MGTACGLFRKEGMQRKGVAVFALVSSIVGMDEQERAPFPSCAPHSYHYIFFYIKAGKASNSHKANALWL
jgi:hypothetical protein